MTLRSYLTGRLSAYRFFLHDPVPFERSLHLSFDHGVANDMESDHASVVYWYQEEPHGAFPELPSAKERLPAWALLNSAQILVLLGVLVGLAGAAAWGAWYLLAGWGGW